MIILIDIHNRHLHVLVQRLQVVVERDVVLVVAGTGLYLHQLIPNLLLVHLLLIVRGNHTPDVIDDHALLVCQVPCRLLCKI